mmetsp:Transcript_6950/g.10148  ORF Transcript_6950/g.10148 Transcript_6950/m.10148 type:complete len:241 (-) Transcript_6950:78-800(-)
MVSLRIGKLKRKSSKKSPHGKENESTSRKSSEKSIASTSHSSSSRRPTDESMGSSDEINDVQPTVVVKLVDSGGGDDKFSYKPANRPANKPLKKRPSLRRLSSDASFKICDSVRELILKRTSGILTRRSSIIGRGVTFIDEVLGLTPRHVVTETHYRPRTSEDEIETIYYGSKDFLQFEREHLYEKVEEEIKAIERQNQRKKDGDVSIEDDGKEAMSLEQVQKLVQKINSRLNLEKYEKV